MGQTLSEPVVEKVPAHPSRHPAKKLDPSILMSQLAQQNNAMLDKSYIMDTAVCA
jgi:hypothetical protein